MWEGQKGLEFMKFVKDRTCKLLDRPGILDSFCLGRSVKNRLSLTSTNEVHTVKKHVISGDLPLVMSSLRSICFVGDAYGRLSKEFPGIFPTKIS